MDKERPSVSSNAELRAIENASRLAESGSANVAKTEFLTAMSHERRTPLNAIAGYTELLTLGLGGPVTPEQQDYLDRIRRSQQHLIGIISDLLNFSRIEGVHLTYDIQALALSDVIKNVVPLVEPQAQAKAISMETDSGKLDCKALGDRAKVNQVLLNPLSNAVKFTGANGSVRVACTTSESTASIAATDAGTGIPPNSWMRSSSRSCSLDVD